MLLLHRSSIGIGCMHPPASQRSPFQPPNFSPLQLQTLAHFLSSHPDRKFTQYIHQGFSFGFRVGYNYNTFTPAGRWHNHPSALANRPVVSERIWHEVGLGRMIGTISLIEGIHTSPIGLVPKEGSGE